MSVYSRWKQGIITGFILLAILPLVLSYFWTELSSFYAAAYGMIFCSVIMVLGFMVLRLTLKRSLRLFLSALFGGILFRLAAVIGSGIYVNYYTSLPLRIFFISVIGYYFLWQILEIIYFQTRVKKDSTFFVKSLESEAEVDSA